MENQKHERFAVANGVLSDFLQSVDGLAIGTESITESDLQTLSQRLSMLAPEVGDASRGEKLDEALQGEIGKYVRNLLALQSALEKVRWIMLARKAHPESAKRRLDGVEGWINAYGQTT